MLIPKEATAREILAAIDQWAKDQLEGSPPYSYFSEDTEICKLWAILTGQRGPDNGDEALKDHTTAIVRAHSLYHLAIANGAVVNTHDDGVTEKYSNLPVETHFIYHAVAAAAALGIGVVCGPATDEGEEA